MTDNFGDRMKAYETMETGRRLIPLLPVYARIDGRCFSRFTHGLERPYDMSITNAMRHTTEFLISETHARIGYTQSDEISLVWLQDKYDSELPFGGKTYKLISVLAGMASARFNAMCFADPTLRERAEQLSPHFDCRVFQLPNKTEATNAFLWREQDATKNAISMAARSFYSHKELHNKTGPDMQEMIFAKGQNFNDYPGFFKRGMFLRREVMERILTPAERERIPEKHRPADNEIVTRSEIAVVDMPKFSAVTNRVGVIFEGEMPRTEEALAGVEEFLADEPMPLRCDVQPAKGPVEGGPR